MLGKSILITGATSGLGLKLTEDLLARGAFVIAVGRNMTNINAIKSDKLTKIYCDFTDQEQVASLMAQIDTMHIDILINCSGFARYGALTEQDDIVIHQMIAVNFTETTLITKHIIKTMHPGSLIVTIGSQSAHVTTPYGAIYAATKSAVNQVMNALRFENPHIHFLVVNTGPINTPFIQKAMNHKPVNHTVEKVQLDVTKVSQFVIQAMIDKKTELNLPNWMHQGLKIYQMAPRQFEKYFKRFFLTKK